MQSYPTFMDSESTVSGSKFSSVTKSQRKMNEHPWKLFHGYCIGCLSTAATKSLAEGIGGRGALLRLQLEGGMDRGAEGLGDCEAIGHTVSAVRIQ